MLQNKHLMMTLLSSAALLVSAEAASAQSTGAASQTQESQAPGEDPNRVEEIVVTAQKREQLIQDVPASVSALSGDQLERIAAGNFEDYATYIPGLASSSQGGPGQRQIILRGINAGDDPAATVGIYVDDIPFGSSSSLATGGRLALDLVPFDLQRIEVLRGPQGTLYGASTLGGLFKYVTRAPNLNRFEGRLEGDIFTVRGGEETYSGRGAVNVPIVDGVAALRLTGFYFDNGGFVDNVTTGRKDVNGNRQYGGRASVLIAPTPDLRIRLTAIAQDIEQDDAALVRWNRATDRPFYDRLATDRTVANSLDQTFRQYSATIDYDLGPVTITSVTAKSNIESPAVGDATASFGAALGSTAVALARDAETDKFVQEIRFTSASREELGAPFEWMIGLFYTKEDSRNDQLLTTANGPLVGLNPLATVLLPTEYEEYAVFTHNTFYFSDRFNVTLGLRFAENKQDFSQTTGGIAVGLPGRTATVLNQSKDDTVTYLVAPTFEVNENLTLYARAASGYRPGGPNAILPNPADPTQSLVPLTFDPDTLWNYEVGLKAAFLNNRAQFNLSAFRIDWDDIQLIQIVNNATFRGNGETARSQGVEAEFAFRPTARLNVGGNIVYTDAELTADTSFIVGGRSGDRLPLLPRWSGALFADYTAPLGSELNGTVGASLRYVGSRETGFPSSPTNPSFGLDSYTQIDLRAGVTWRDISLTAFARNLTDETQLLGGSSIANQLYLAVGRPRSFGLTLGANF